MPSKTSKEREKADVVHLGTSGRYELTEAFENLDVAAVYPSASKALGGQQLFFSHHYTGRDVVAQALDVPTFLQVKAAPHTYGGGETHLRQEIASLRMEISRLAESVAVLSRAVLRTSADAETSLREVSPEQAREEILAFLKHEVGPAYPSDIAAALELDYDLVAQTLDTLRREGLAKPSEATSSD